MNDGDVAKDTEGWIVEGRAEERINVAGDSKGRTTVATE